MAFENQDLIEYQEWEKKQGSIKNKLIGKINITTLLLCFFAILILAYLWQTQEQNRTLFLIGAIGIIIFLFWQSQQKEKKILLPEYIAVRITQAAMDRKVGFNKQFPPGTQIKVDPEVRTRWRDSEATGTSEPFRIDVGVTVTYPNSLTRFFVYYLTPYEGIPYALVDAPTGFTGLESPDLKFVEKNMVIVDNTKEQEMNKF